MAAAVGMSALAASITLIVLYRRLTREGEKYVTISSRGYRPTRDRSQGGEDPALRRSSALLSFVLIVLPVVVLFYTSLVPYVDGAEREGLLDDELEALARRSSRTPSRCFR